MIAAAAASSSHQAMWFASRGTGVVALLLVTASMLLGVLTTVRFETDGWPRFVIQMLHRNVSLLILVFVAVHVATTVVDGFVPIGFLDAVVPFRSPYRTIWLGLGTVAFDLLLALCITSVLRARIGYMTWRAVHWCAYLCWPIALLHGFKIGSDRHERWMLGIDIASVVLVVIAGSWRFVESRRNPPDTIGPAGPISILARNR